MPLLDHFRSPLKDAVGWHSFHHAWCTLIAINLNRILPEQFRAVPHVQYGLEIDVAAYDSAHSASSPRALREVVTAPYLAVDNPGGPEQVPPISWQPPPPVQTIPFVLMTESVEVLIYNSVTNPSLVGAVELVSEANKDRPAERQAFLAKCEAYLRQGVGLVIVDIVTTYRANLHHELLVRLDAAPSSAVKQPLYTTAYRPVQHNQQIALDIWQEALTLGQALPTLPLWLRREFCAPLFLEATYQETCQALRIPTLATPEASPM